MNKKYHIAVIDDEKSIQQTLTLALEQENYIVTAYNSGQHALDNIFQNLPDLIILDIMMPGLDGISFCSLFRESDKTTPIIFVTSRADETTKIEALERGGDDYISKPFSIKELMVRVKVCLKRLEIYKKTDKRPIIENEQIYINRDEWQIYIEGEVINFSVTEFRIFQKLYNNPGTVFTRDDLMNAAYPEDKFISDRNIDTHITRIRKKICKKQNSFKGITSVYGLGYRYKN